MCQMCKLCLSQNKECVNRETVVVFNLVTPGHEEHPGPSMMANVGPVVKMPKSQK